MTDYNTLFLSALKYEMGSRLMPAIESGMARQIAMYSYRILGRLVTNARHLPDIQAKAMADYTDLLECLKPLLSSQDEKILFTELEEQLDGNREYKEVELIVQRIIGKLVNDRTTVADAAIQKIVAIENKTKKAVMDAYNKEIVISGSNVMEPEIFTAEEKQRLTNYLREKFPGNESLELGDIKAVPGGFSKQTIFVNLNNAISLPEAVVIRLDKSDSPVGSTVVDEFHIIKTLFDAGVAVPEPFAMEKTGKVLGGAFLVVSKVEGGNAGDAVDVKHGSKALAMDLALKLAKMHSVPPEIFGNDIVGASVSTKERLRKEIDAFESQWRSFNHPSIALEVAFAWLKNNIELAEGTRSLIHKDVGCHNMLVQDDKVTAFLDWETAAIGNPAQDLAYVCKTVVQMCEWDDFMKVYGESGGPVPDNDQLQYYALWGFTWLNAMLVTASMAFTSGMSDNIQLGYAGTYLMSRLQAQLAEELNKVLK